MSTVEALVRGWVCAHDFNLRAMRVRVVAVELPGAGGEAGAQDAQASGGTTCLTHYLSNAGFLHT